MATAEPTLESGAGLAAVQTTGRKLKNRLVIYGTEGIGKTSFAAQFPNPIFIQSTGETGLETLIDAGQLPETSHFPECTTWSQLTMALHAVKDEEHSYRTLIIDTLNGCEQLCHDEVCRKEFNGDWGEKGFMGYMRGFTASVKPWKSMFLFLLDEIRRERDMTVICLAHAKVATFHNPDGADFDKYEANMHAKTWDATKSWADCVYFYNYEVHVTESNIEKKGKARPAQFRMLYTQKRAAWDAKNRLGLPAEISMGESAVDGFANYKAAVIEARKEK